MFKYLGPVVGIALAAASGQGAVTSIDLNRATPPADAGLSEYVSNDLSIDFTGQLTGNQLVVALEQGSIFQAGSGGDGAPSSGSFNGAPQLAFDSFLTSGGLTEQTDEGTTIADVGAVNVPGGSGDKQFDSDGGDALWFPSPGTRIETREDFPIARITMNEAATGQWAYLGATDADAAGRVFGPLPIRGGRMIETGDLNLDGRQNNLDINPFVLALTDPSAFEDQFNADPAGVGDLNGDGELNNLDINPFVEQLTSGSAPRAVPEPGSVFVLGVSGALVLLHRRRAVRSRMMQF